MPVVTDALLGESDAMLLSDRLRMTLAHEIASGQLPGGSLLDEQVIASRFGISRTPVREALRQLAAVELIDLRPRRGAVVATVSQERLMALFEAAAEIEATCARLATYRMTMAERATLQRVHLKATEARKCGDSTAYVALNHEFHDLIYRATHNEVLVEQATALRNKLGEFRNAQLRDDTRVGESHDEHGDLMAAMAQGDGAAAERLMRAHLLNAASSFQALVDSSRPIGMHSNPSHADSA
jgi:DNA-binding GntR family transcriptional regulator